QPHISISIFPYTTLFRSQLTQIEKEVGKKSDQSYVNNLNKKVNIQLTQIEKEVGKKSDQSYVDNLNEKVNAQLTQTKYLATRPRDRKSTRLNSSHVSISY